MDQKRIYTAIKVNKGLIPKIWLIIIVPDFINHVVQSISFLFVMSALQVFTAIWLVSEIKVPSMETSKILDNVNYTRYQMINEQDVMNLKNNEQDFELRLDSKSVSLIRRR